MAKRTFSDVSFVAEHVPETHRTLENDHTVTSVELPGMVTVYLVIDGGRLPFTQLRGADVLEAIDRAASQRQTQRGTTGSQPAVAQTQQQPPQWTQTQAPPEAQAPAEPTAPYEQTDPTAPDTQQQ